MGLLLGNLKMPGQREQLIVHHPRHLTAGKGQNIDAAVGKQGSVIPNAGRTQEIEVKFQVIAHQRIFAHECEKRLQRGQRLHTAAPLLRRDAVSFATTSGRGSVPRTRAENSSAG